MLQRAASNAYSWWWASHIRTKQSKWLEQNLQDQEEKVSYMLKMMSEDGDSFARRAEMYYKRRPELIAFIEESFRAYRALAERYDHISTELQNANTTIAAVFPEQVQFSMDDEDESRHPARMPKNFPQIPPAANAPKAPAKGPAKEFKGIVSSAQKKFQPKKGPTRPQESKGARQVPKSGLTEPQALEEIDKVQKDILALQTTKEYVKSSYDKQLERYYAIEEQIKEMQQKVSSLQDEFGLSSVIEDDEARNLMAEAALKSCQDTLAQLEEEQEKSAEEARVENERIQEVTKRLMLLKSKLEQDENSNNEILGNETNKEKKQNPTTKEIGETGKDRPDLKVLREKIKEQIEAGSKGSITVSELAEKIDHLVNKVINLESAYSSQTALINNLRTETDDLQAQIRDLEGDKESLINDKHNLSKTLREMEEKLRGVQDLNKNVVDQNTNLQTHFTEARCSLDHLSDKLQDVQPDEEVDGVENLQTDEMLQKGIEKLQNMKLNEEVEKGLEKSQNVKPNEIVKKEDGKQQNVKTGEEVDKGKTNEDVKKEHGKQQDVKTNEKLEKGQQTVEPDEEKGEKNLKLDEETEKRVKNEKGNEELEIGVVVKEELVKALKEEKEHEAKEEGDRTKEVTVNVTVNVLPVPGEGRGEEKDKDKEVIDKCEVSKQEGKGEKMNSAQLWRSPVVTEAKRSGPGGEGGEKEVDNDDDINWQRMLLSGEEDKEKILLKEYTTILRNYKEVKKRLSDAEKSTHDRLFEKSLELRELKIIIAKRDQENQALRNKLNQLLERLGESVDTEEGTDIKLEASDLKNENKNNLPKEEEEEEDIKLIMIDQPQAVSPIEEKLRMRIDAVLEDNLRFWLKFSKAIHEIQKFKSEVYDLQNEIVKLKGREVKKQEQRPHFSTTSSLHSSSSFTHSDLKSNIRAIYKHLSEKRTEITVWVEESGILKVELQNRFSSICDIQEEITIGLKEGVEEDTIKFSSHQAAKFQGEVMNMKQENYKVREELQAALDHATGLLLEVEQTLDKLDYEFGLSEGKYGKPPLMHTGSKERNSVPLRNFLFGVKQKKKKSIFDCMHQIRKQTDQLL